MPRNAAGQERDLRTDPDWTPDSCCGGVMAVTAPERTVVRPGPRITVSRGLLTITVATVALFLASWLFAPTSVSKGALLGMLPFAAVLAHRPLGQTLVVQQGGIDLSVPGAVSLAVVIVTHEPNGDDSKLLGAVLLALGVAIARRPGERPSDRPAGSEPDRRDAGHERPAVRRCSRHLWRLPQADHRSAGRHCRRRRLSGFRTPSTSRSPPP